MMSKAKYYPPYESRYERTYTLYGGWQSRISNLPSGIYLQIWNYVRYAGWVQGPEQLPLFRFIGWFNIPTIVKDIRRTFRHRIQAVVNRSID